MTVTSHVLPDVGLKEDFVKLTCTVCFEPRESYTSILDERVGTFRLWDERVVELPAGREPLSADITLSNVVFFSVVAFTIGETVTLISVPVASGFAT